MDPLVQNLIGTVVRWALGLLAGWLIGAGLLPAGSQTEWVAGLSSAVIVIIWSAYQKYASAKLLTAALNLPAGSSVAEAKAAAKPST